MRGVKLARAGDLDPSMFESLRDRDREPMPPEADCLWIEDENGIGACAALGVARDPRGEPSDTSWLGYYAARDADSGAAVLREAVRLAGERGRSRVLGPLNESTWRRYRVALASAPEDPLPNPPFFPGEPRNPLTYEGHFAEAGYGVAARYESRLVSLDPGAPPRSLPVPADIRVRALDASRFPSEMERIFDLSLAAFADNAFYSPIGREGFFALYEPIRPILDPDLVLLAERPDGALAGYLFSYPDPTSKARRVIAKTMAVDPSARGLGLGTYLLAEIGVRAAARGYGEVMHALMHVTNRSQRMSARLGAALYRRYALYEHRT